MKKSYYAIIPANVRYDEELKPNAKLLYGEITALANEKGYCWASNSYFAELYGVSKETISRWINNLENRGYINTQLIYRKGSKEIKERRIFIAPIDKIVNTPCQNNQYPIDEKINTPIDEIVKDNNTLFNNTLYIYDYWNSKGIIRHRKLTNRMKTKIQSTLKDYSLDEIKEIIDNYAEILLNDKYWFNYKWTLEDFLQRGMAKFEDLKAAKQNYLKDEYKNTSNESDPYAWMDIKE